MLFSGLLPLARIRFCERSLLALVLCCAAACISAQTLQELQSPGESPAAEEADRIVSPWLSPARKFGKELYFSNLKDGQSVESPFVARFGASNVGIVPAGKTVGSHGHLHLLIDTPLPVDLKKPLPFSANYIHFGKGQMEALVDLSPGTHTVRLLLANYAHVLYFVYSEELTIMVTKQNKGVTPASVLGSPRVFVMQPAAGSTVYAPFRMALHASGFNLSHSAANAEGTGYFRVNLQRTGSKGEAIDLKGGQTEFWLAPPKGEYLVLLEWVSNDNGKVQASAKAISFSVQ